MNQRNYMGKPATTGTVDRISLLVCRGVLRCRRRSRREREGRKGNGYEIKHDL